MQGLSRFLHLLYREAFTAAVFHGFDGFRQLVDLLLKQAFLPLRGNGDFLKLAVADNHRVIVAGGNSGTEFLPPRGLKVLLCGHQQLGTGIEGQKLAGPLTGQVVGHHKEAFLAEPQTLALHGAGCHFKGFACAYLVRQQRISTVEHMGDGPTLMLAERDFRIHAPKYNVTAVVFPGPGAVEQLVIPGHQSLPPLGLLPDPGGKCILDGLLLLLGQRGFLFVENALLLTFRVLNRIVNSDVL